MMEFFAEVFVDWPYDDGLRWMADRALAVRKNPHRVFVACGSHLETVISLGRHCFENAFSREKINSCNYVIKKTERGGGITAHEPGQLVLYPVLNLNYHGLTIKTLVNVLETIMMSFLADLNIFAVRSSIGHGVFVGLEKIGFLGLRIVDHITSHGIAINVKNHGQIFSAFDPCGIKGQAVTSVIHHAFLDLPLVSYAKLLSLHFERSLRDVLARPNLDGDTLRCGRIAF